MPEILDGKKVQEAILESLKPRVRDLAARVRPPGLAVVLVGSDPASEIYVRNKVKACRELGIYSEQHLLAADISNGELLQLIRSLNTRPEIDGILVQSPLPDHLDESKLLLAIDPAKDVDGFHPLNVGLLVSNSHGPRACTPAGIMKMLEYYRIPLAGKRAVVVGRSDIVGKPMALLLLHANATVTVCHSKTRDLAAECRRADIVVAAIGRPAFLAQEHVPDGAVVVDVGINRLTARADVEHIFDGDPDKLAALENKGSVLVGDVHPAVYPRCQAYSPVPGGVGPLTIAMLMSNTVACARRHLGVRED
jgi:methylenetetrahydrofolate dehydrogenase (NADP+)/methenyltetrahydrofolate cyclohydrolase